MTDDAKPKNLKPTWVEREVARKERFATREAARKAKYAKTQADLKAKRGANAADLGIGSAFVAGQIRQGILAARHAHARHQRILEGSASGTDLYLHKVASQGNGATEGLTLLALRAYQRTMKRLKRD